MAVLPALRPREPQREAYLSESIEHSQAGDARGTKALADEPLTDQSTTVRSLGLDDSGATIVATYGAEAAAKNADAPLLQPANGRFTLVDL